MRLPFTDEQFFDIFAAYNAALWPAVIALWIASFAVCALIVASPRRVSDRLIGALLAIHWAWSGLLYHGTFFTQINPAAWLFMALFLIEAGLFLWRGLIQERLRFTRTRSKSTTLAWMFIAYALAYPAINGAQHLHDTRFPTFGVPCPTTILTAGLLMLAGPRNWQLSVIPIIWSVIGGSAAVLLDVKADYALPIAGVALAVSSVRQAT